MMTSTIRLLLVGLVATLGIACPVFAADIALTGRVTSIEEGAMEGVLVSAHRDGSPITVTVVTGSAGNA